MKTAIPNQLVKCAQYSVWREEQVMFIYSVGTWGKSDAERFCTDYLKIRRQLKNQPWAVISHSKNWVLGTPEIGPVIAQLGTEEINSGLVASARIVNEIAVTQYQLRQIIKDTPQKHLTHAFTDEREAFAWLRELGFKPETQSFNDSPNI